MKCNTLKTFDFHKYYFHFTLLCSIAPSDKINETGDFQWEREEHALRLGKAKENPLYEALAL